MVNLSSQTRLEMPCVATVGCFDGVHRGHQLLLSRVVGEARQRGLRSVVVTFDRVPRQLFDSSFHPQLLSTAEEKEVYLHEAGIDEMVLLPFTKALAGLSAETFMRDVLCGQMSAKVLLAGYDNRFGHNRLEGFADYVRYGRQMGMEVVRGDVARMADTEQAVSSTLIRQLLADEGRVELMPECLTRWYSMTGTVVPGEHIGHTLGYPTANLQPLCADKLVPAAGVYAVLADVEDTGQRMPAMMNIGTRPTFDGTKRTLEVHILQPVGNIYGRRMTVSFLSRLRAEQRFESREALVEQLGKDREETLKRLNHIKEIGDGKEF